MHDPIFQLFSHITENNLHLQYMTDPAGYQARRKRSFAAYERLARTLEPQSKEELSALLDENVYLNAIESEALFTAGLSTGLKFLRLL